MKARDLRDTCGVAVADKIELDDNTACTERRIVVRFIVLDLKKYSFGDHNLENKILNFEDNEQSSVQKKQEGGFIEYLHNNNDYLMRVIEYWG